LIFAAEEARLAAVRTIRSAVAGWLGRREDLSGGSSGSRFDAGRGIEGHRRGRYLLVDVREPNEVAVDAYPGAVVVPLSSFDPQAIPDPKGKQVVFACRPGNGR
jgi:hypothetical protein